MKGRPNDLAPWLKKSQKTPARVNPDDDPEETERRSHLARSASSLVSLPRPRLTLDRSREDIEPRSLDISKKKRLARTIDKARDLGEVTKLVERPRQSIVIHQVSIIHDRSQKSLTRGTGVTATVHIQPGC